MRFFGVPCKNPVLSAVSSFSTGRLAKHKVCLFTRATCRLILFVLVRLFPVRSSTPRTHAFYVSGLERKQGGFSGNVKQGPDIIPVPVFILKCISMQRMPLIYRGFLFLFRMQGGQCS